MIDRQHNNYTPQIIKKSNFLIEKSNNLPFCIQKILDLILSEIQANKISSKELKIHGSKFISLIGEKLTYRTVDYFEKIGEKLIGHIVKLIDKTDEALDLTSLISRFTLKDGYIHIKITDEFQAFADLDFVHADGEKTIKKGYTVIDFNKIKLLKNKHSIPLYQYLLMIKGQNNYYKPNKSQTNTYIDLDKLKLLLCKDLHSYDNTNLFKFKVLDKAVKEINEKTDINISYTSIKAEDNKTIIGFNFDIKRLSKEAKEQPSNLLNDIINIVKEPIKAVYKAIKPKEQNPVYENLPELILQSKEWGYCNIKQLLDMYNGTEEKKYQISAIIAQISLDYADKTNNEKCKILSALIKRNAHANALAIYNAKKEETLKKQQIEKSEIERLQAEEKKQTEREIIKQNNREIFEQELKKEESQLARIWKAVSKTVELNIPIHQFKTWFNPAIANIKDNTLNILLPNRFKADFFKNKLLCYVYEALRNINSNLQVNLKVGI